jgi:ubiquinone/menaquinone biosynthesis C-methylase UbiE
VELKNKMSGRGIEHMPNLAFRLMSFALSIRDLLIPVGKKLDQFNIDNGFFIVDFGCGPGSFVEYASKLVGNSGKVYAVDVHPLAIKAIKEKNKKKDLENVVPVLSTGYPVDIESHSADIIYALDMFHHIKDASGFLKELHRLLKPNGKLFIESGHQTLSSAKQKIVKGDYWVIIKEDRNMFKCTPKEQRNT